MALTIQTQLTLLMFQLNGALTADSIAISVVERRAVATAMMHGVSEAAATQARPHLEPARNLADNMPSKVFGNGMRVARFWAEAFR